MEKEEIDVTLWRGTNGTVGIVPWTSKTPSNEELTPKGSELLVYTRFNKDLVNAIISGSKRDRDEFINDYLP